MILIAPTMEYDREIRAFRRECLEYGSEMDGGSHLRRFERTQDWLDQIEPFTSQYIYVREEDGAVVGMIQIRRRLNEYLQKYAGHIGYCVRPTERRKGYAGRMLAAALAECGRLGIYDVLVSCYPENEASRKTILKNGGEYLSAVAEPETGKTIERYRIRVPAEEQNAADAGT